MKTRMRLEATVFLPEVYPTQTEVSRPCIAAVFNEQGHGPKPASLLTSTWSGRWDLNPRPPEPHSGTLPSCATARRLGRV